MAQRKNTLSKNFLEKLQEKNSKDESQKIQIPSGNDNVAVETLIAISGLMAGIWGGAQSLANVKEGFDPKSIIKGQESKYGLKDLFVVSNSLKTVIDNDKHIFGKKGGEKALSLLDKLNNNVAKFVKSISASNTPNQKIQLDVTGNFDAKKYKELLESLADPNLDRLTESDFTNGLQLVIDTLKQFNELEISKLTGNVSTQLGELIDIVNEDVTKLENIDNIRIKLIEFKQGIEDIHIDSEGGVFKDLKDIIDKMSILASYDTKDISLDPIIDAITKLNDENLQKLLEDSNKTEKNFNNLKQLIDNKNSGLSGIIDSIKKLASEGNNLNQNSSEGIIGITNAIATILSIDASPMSIIKLQTSIQLMNPLFKKDLKELINVISTNFNDKETKDVLNKVRNVQGIFSALSSIGINPLRIVAASINIKMIKGTLIKNVLELFKEIAEVTNKNNEPYKDASKGINNLKEIIDLITNTSSISLKSKIGMIMDFEYIRAFVLPTMSKILGSIIELNGDYNESVTRSIGDLKILFETLTKITDIKDETLDEMREKVKELDFIIDDDLKILFEDLKKLPVSKDDITKSMKMNALIESMFSVFDTMPNLLKFFLAEKKYQILSQLVKIDSKIVDEVNNIKLTADTLKKYDNVNKLLNKIQILIPNIDSALENLKKISQSIENLNDAILQMIKISDGAKAIETTAKVYAKIPEILKGFIEGFKDINEKDIDNATKTLKEMNKIVIISAGVLLFAALASMLIPMKDVFQFAMSLGLFILMFGGAIRLATPALMKDSHETIREFGHLILISGATLILASVIYHFLDFGDLFGFAASLGLFMWGMMAILANKTIQSNVQNSWETMREFGYLILISGATLILGSVIYHFLNWGDLFGFVGGLALFTWTMTGLYAVLNLVIDKAIEGAKDFAILVTASGFTLMLGALLYTAVPWTDVLGFTFQLTAFVGAMILIFAAPQILAKKIPKLANPFKEAMKGAKDFAILILASAFSLFLGAAVSKAVDWKAIGLFTFELTAFIIGVSLAYRIATFNNKGSMRGAKQFSILLGVSAMILIIGGMLFTWMPGIIPGTALFAVILGGFMIAVGKAYKIASKGISKNITTAYQMALLIAISGGMLLFAGWIMDEFPDAQINIPIFTGCVLALNMGMAYVLKGLAKAEGDLKKGIIAMLSISVSLGITALAFKKLAETAAIIEGLGGTVKFGILVGVMLVTLTAVSGLIVGLAAALGNGITTTMAYIAIGVVLAAAAAIWVVTDSMQKTADALETLANVKAIKVDQLISNVGAIISIAGALSPLTNLAPIIYVVSIAVEEMAHMMSKIAETVQQYASLKIPIYDGMKQVGYRQLSKGDFKEAGKNVSLIIKTLGKAVIDTYDQNPEIFEANLLGFGKSKFQIVAKSLGSLGPMLTSIAESVQEYASLNVGTDYKKNSMGILMPTKYRKLNKEDFKSAANNVKQIISVLGNAVIEIHDEKPEIFEEPTFFGKSKFSKVVKSLSGLGPMLSTIARSVKDYANLTVGEDYKKDPKLGVLMPTRYEHLDEPDFKAAAKNVKHIITVLGEAIISAYEEHPDYYETGKGLISGLIGSSPFTKTIKANMMLGTMISKIASSVKDYANLTVGEDYQKDPKLGVLMPTRYEHLDDTDFKNAAKNVVSIMSTLGDAIIKVYEAHPTYYETSGGILGFGGSSPFTKTIKANMMLGTMISKIASSVKDYANLTVGEDYQKDPKLGILMPTRYRHLDKDDFNKAASNVQTILETLGKAIINTYNDNPDMYDNSGLFGTGDSPFIKTINANLKLGELISTIGKSVRDLADFKIGEDYEKNSAGILMPTKYKNIGPEDFKNAANNINLIITTLGSSIMNAYNDPAHEDWFDDGEDSIFAQACTAIGTMGTMINEIAHGIQGYADLKIAKYDDKGNIAGYDKIDDKMFTRASNHISEIVTNLGQTVIHAYEQHPDWFDDGAESKFTLACTAITGMGEMIGSVAEGIQNYADLKIPVKWDDKGNPTEYKELNDDVFTNAQKNVGDIVNTLGESIQQVYIKHPSWFQSEVINTKSGILGSESKESDPPFIKVVKGCIMMGELISSIAEGIQDYASGRMPVKWDENGNPIDWVKLDDGIYETAAEKIGTVIVWIGTAISTVYKDHQEWFAPSTVLSKGPGLFSSAEFKESDPPFIKAVKSCLLMGNVISNIAEGIQNYAELKMPVYDENGIFTGKYEKMPDKVFTEAGKNIGKVITGIGNAIKSTYKTNKELFEDNKYEEIVNSTSKIGTMISSIAKGIENYASLKYPIAWDTDGNPIAFEKMGDTAISDAADKISIILTTVGKTVAKVADNEIFNNFNIAKVNNMLESMKKTSSVINMMAKTIHKYSTMQFVEYDPETKTMSAQILTQPKIQSAIESIGKVLTTIGTAIVDTVDGNERIFGKNINESPAFMAAAAIGKIGEALNAIARSIAFYANDQFPVITFNNGKLHTKIFELKEEDYAHAEESIKKVVTAIGRVLKATYEENPELFSNDAKGNNPIGNIVKGISGMTDAISKIITEVQKVVALNVTDIVQQLSESDTSLKVAVKSIASMYKTLTQDSTTVEITTEEHLFSTDVTQRRLSIGEQWAHKADKLRAIVTGCEAIFDAVNSIFSTINKIVGIKDINNTDNFDTIKQNVVKYINGFKDISAAFDGMKAFAGITDANTINNNLDMVDALVDRIIPILNKITGIKDGGDLQPLINLIGKFKEVIEKLKGIVSNENENKIDFSTFNFENASKDINEKINLFTDNVDKVIDLSEHSKEVGTEGLSNISTGISEVDRVLQEIKGIENFTKHNVELDKYIKTVNKLQLSKVNGLTNMINAMNILSSRLGNVDKLTDAIAEKLSTVLDRLVAEMKEAEKIIKESEIIQKKRHELIEKSTKNVVEIMKQKLVVEISQVQDTAGLTGQGATSTGTDAQSSDGGTNIGSGAGPGTVTSPNDGPNTPNTTPATTTGGGTNVVSQPRGTNSGNIIVTTPSNVRNNGRSDSLLSEILAEIKRGIKIKN